MNFYDYNGMSGGDFQSKFNDYASKSEDELMSELNKTVNRMKEEGSFDVNMLENLYRTASPMLNDMQKSRMRSIIDMLKG